jgi:hypothetical protein
MIKHVRSVVVLALLAAGLSVPMAAQPATAACGLRKEQGPMPIPGSGTIAFGYLVYNSCSESKYARAKSNTTGRVSTCLQARPGAYQLLVLNFDDRDWKVEACSTGRGTAATPSFPTGTPCMGRFVQSTPVPPNKFAYTVYNSCDRSYRWRVHFPTQRLRTACISTPALRFGTVAAQYATSNWVVESC